MGKKQHRILILFVSQGNDKSDSASILTPAMPDSDSIHWYKHKYHSGLSEKAENLVLY